jgi:pimeloyl-ACP methyl ester carboxylesterase
MKKNMKIIAVLIALGFGLPIAWAQTEIPVVSSIELTLKTPTGDLYGTYTGPRNVGIIPVVLIIPGSGPTDRDGNSLLGIQTNAYKLLAEELAKNKIASLRIDKRGIGKSKSAVKNESDMRFDTYVDDAAAWINSLKTEHNYEKVYVLGHSEGSLVGMLAAQREKISGFISLAGSGRSVDVLLREQLKSLPLELLNEANMIMDSLKAGKTSSEVNPGLMAFFRPSVQPYMISWIKYDPAKEINKLNVPTLIIQGTNDIQVTKEDAILLSKSKPSATLLFLENMNHVLKDADTDLAENLATYKNPDLPINAQLIKVLTQFISVVTK